MKDETIASLIKTTEKPASFEDRFRSNIQPSRYPTQEDVLAAEKAGVFNQSPVGEFLGNPDAKMRQLFSAAPLNEKQLPDPQENKQPISEEIRGILKQAYVASRLSGVASLGFDPAIINIVHPAIRGRNGEQQMRPGPRSMWFTKASPQTAVHESFHEGFSVLEEATTNEAIPKELRDEIKSVLPKGYQDNELFVRALMLKHFGGVEELSTIKRTGEFNEKSKRHTLEEQYVAAQKMLDKYPDRIIKLDEVASKLAQFKRGTGAQGPR